MTQRDEAINKQISSHDKYLAWQFEDSDTSLCTQAYLSKLMNQLLLSNKGDPPAADWNVMFSVSLKALASVSTRESVILLEDTCGFPQNLCANYIERRLYASPQKCYLIFLITP